MNSFLILPEDLKKEIHKYLHKQYYDVILVELLDMTRPVYTHFTYPHYFPDYSISAREFCPTVVPYGGLISVIRWCVMSTMLPPPNSNVFILKKEL